jgi:hypothetical protein
MIGVSFLLRYDFVDDRFEGTATCLPGEGQRPSLGFVRYQGSPGSTICGPVFLAMKACFRVAPALVERLDQPADKKLQICCFRVLDTFLQKQIVPCQPTSEQARGQPRVERVVAWQRFRGFSEASKERLESRLGQVVDFGQSN